MKLKSQPFTDKGVEAFSCRSDATGDDFAITIGLPHSYEDNPDKSYPALIVLDGATHFSCVNMLARYLVFEIDDVIVIGVDVPAVLDQLALSKRRVRHFTPAMDWPMTDPSGAALKSYLASDTDSSTEIDSFLGGADAFLAFLDEELLSDLRRRYRIDAEDIGIVGNSAGGFFASTLLFREQTPFRRFFISSPAMAYGDGEIFRREAAWADAHKDLRAEVVMGAGALEIDNRYYEGLGKIISGMTRFAGLLGMREYPSLRMTCDVMNDVGHIDSLFPTVARGMRRFYAREHPFTAI